MDPQRTPHPQEQADEPRSGAEDAHEHGVLLTRLDEPRHDGDPGEALDVQALDGFVG